MGGKNFDETIDKWIALHGEMVTICNKLIALLEPLIKS